jgi:prepilin-type N-terminal cleavage/methylation domain-containing protein
VDEVMPTTTPHFPRSQAGFTLVEIIACVLLFAVGMMGVVGVVVYGLKSARNAQAEASAWSTGLSVLRDPLPLGVVSEPTTGILSPWTWSKSGSTWVAYDGTAQTPWQYTSWPIDLGSDVLVPDMRNPKVNNSAVFPVGGNPITGCAHGWLNGYYVERREQSRGSDRIGQNTRIVEIRVDVYWASYSYSVADGVRPLASVIDRQVRQGNL